MAVIQVLDYWESKVFVNFPKGGFSETYKFPDMPIADAKTTAKRFASARADLLALNFSVAHVSLSKKESLRDSYRPDTYRSAGTVLAVATDVGGTVNPCNDPEVGPIWRFDTGDGKFVNRCIRGLRDSQITNNAALLTSITPNSLATVNTNAAPTATVTTHDAVLTQFLSTVFRLSRLYSAKGATIPGSYDEYDFFNSGTVTYRRVGSHDVGQRYGVGRGRQPSWA